MEGGLATVPELQPGCSWPDPQQLDPAAVDGTAPPSSGAATKAGGVGDASWSPPATARPADAGSILSVASLAPARKATGADRTNTTHRVSASANADVFADLLNAQVPLVQPEPPSPAADCCGDDGDLLGTVEVVAINASFASSRASSVAAPALWPPGAPTGYPSPLPQVPSLVDSHFPQDPRTCSSPLLGEHIRLHAPLLAIAEPGVPKVTAWRRAVCSWVPSSPVLGGPRRSRAPLLLTELGIFKMLRRAPPPWAPPLSIPGGSD